MNDSRDSRHPFDEALRRWAGRPPAVPPGAAATRVLARIAEDQRADGRANSQPLLRRLAWGTLAAAAVLSLGVWQLPQGRPGTSPAAAGVVDPAPPLDEGVLLLWIDHDTPLYMTLEPPAPAGERHSS